jgi:hypothetical protein
MRHGQADVALVAGQEVRSADRAAPPVEPGILLRAERRVIVVGGAIETIGMQRELADLGIDQRGGFRRLLTVV